eukprot:179388_1
MTGTIFFVMLPSIYHAQFDAESNTTMYLTSTTSSWKTGSHTLDWIYLLLIAFGIFVISVLSIMLYYCIRRKHAHAISAEINQIAYDLPFIKDQNSTVNAILDAVIFYQSLNLFTDDDKQKLLKYYESTYPELLEDFINLITKYSHNMDDIYEVATKKMDMCDVLNCAFTQRHCRDRKTDAKYQQGNDPNSETEEELQFMFIRDMFDGIHCYILHQYDFGYRKHHDGIQKSSHTFHHPRKNKFNIPINESNLKSVTFMDRLYNHVNTRFGDKELSEMRTFFENEEFDSDAIQQDIKDSVQESNVMKAFGNQKYSEIMYTFIRQSQLSQSAFSMGIIFYYWEYYKHLETNSVPDIENEGNINDHSGYNIVDLYVQPKYTNLKTEILYNKIFNLNINEYKISSLKVEKYIVQPVVKNIIADVWEDLEDKLHYGIPSGKSLGRTNLLALVLYTDWSELCTEFGKTFRKKDFFETLNSVKKRNREFSRWSRVLRETVEYFGYCGRGQIVKAKSSKEFKINILVGPFYCGLSKLITIPQFNIRLCAPTSTSRQKEVAFRFGGEEGMILELNNNGDQRCDQIRAFGCAWISNYQGEDEWLFIGGYERISIKNIRDIKTKESFRTFIQAFYLLDCILQGACFDTENQ